MLMTRTTFVRLTMAVTCAAALSLPTAAQTTTNPQTQGSSDTHGTQSTQKDPATAGTSGQVTAADKAFVLEAAQGGIMEVELGKIASEKGVSADVKQFGQRMVTDHSKANEQLMTLAKQKNITIPEHAGDKHKAEIDRFSKLSGQAFDRAYMQHMVKDHQKDVKAFHQQATGGKDPQIQEFAKTTLPTLQDHLEEAERIAKQVGTSGPAGTTGREKPKTSGGQ